MNPGTTRDTTIICGAAVLVVALITIPFELTPTGHAPDIKGLVWTILTGVVAPTAGVYPAGSTPRWARRRGGMASFSATDPATKCDMPLARSTSHATAAAATVPY